MRSDADRTRGGKSRSAVALLVVLGVILGLSPVAGASGPKYPAVFEGKSVTATLTNEDYTICTKMPDGHTCYAGPGYDQWHVYNGQATFNFAKLTFKQTSAGSGSYTLTGGSGTINGTEQNTNTYTDNHGTAHACSFTTTRSTDSGSAAGTLVLSSQNGNVTLSVPTVVSYSSGSGDCGTFDGFSNAPPPTGHAKNYTFDLGPYDSAKQKVTLTTGNCSNATCSAAGTLQAWCVVPRVTGKPLNTAKAAVTASGCSVGRVTHATSHIAKGHVISEKPKAGSKLPYGAKVSLVVSSGP